MGINALEKLQSIGQQDLLKYFELLSDTERTALENQIDSLDIAVLKKQQKTLLHFQPHTTGSLEPFLDFYPAGNKKDYKAGVELIAQGKVGCLIVAGGQGTRLRFDGPKGAFPISVVKHKSLFQLFAEKTIAAGKRAGRMLPLAIMTSPLNHSQTIEFFKKNQFFGLQPEQVSFFSQGLLPILNDEGNMFLESPYSIALGPDGNGSSLRHFYQQGIWGKWKDAGVQYLNYILVDNALADPFDAELIGFHKRTAAEIIVKCTSRKDVDEKVGLLVKENGKVKVVEYSEFPEKERLEVNSDGSLKNKCANISLFSFQMDFVKRKSLMNMPLHVAHKAISMLNKNGKVEYPKGPNAWKFEEFIFDLLPMAEKVCGLLYPREICFAPLKNSTGEASPETVKAALEARDRAIYREVNGEPAPAGPIELPQEFYYP